MSCAHLQFGTATSTGVLGSLLANEVVHCSLSDMRFVPQRTNIVERMQKRAWDPGQLPTAVFRKGDVEVPAVVGLGASGDLPIRAQWNVLATFESNRIRLLDAEFSGDEDFSDAYLVSGRNSFPIWEVTGATSPDSLWMETVQLFSNASGTEISGELIDNEGRAWVAGEFTGQIFRRTLDDAQFIISDNAGSRLFFSSNVVCSQCNYEIITRVAGQYSSTDPAFDDVRLTSRHLTFAPQDPLDAGVWQLQISGGTDLLGLALTDGLRDGNEIDNVPDDTLVFEVEVP